MQRHGGSHRKTAADDALIRSVYEEHGGALLGYSMRLMGDRQAAEDVVQETLVRAWRNPEVLTNGKGSVRGWLLTVARNLVVDRSRARATRPLEVSENPEAVPVTDDHADTVVDTLLVEQVLERLSDDHRQVLVELYYKGSSVAETATTLGVPAGTVRSRCYYALRMMRRQLTPYTLQEEAGG